MRAGVGASGKRIAGAQATLGDARNGGAAPGGPSRHCWEGRDRIQTCDVARRAAHPRSCETRTRGRPVLIYRFAHTPELEHLELDVRASGGRLSFKARGTGTAPLRACDPRLLRLAERSWARARAGRPLHLLALRPPRAEHGARPPARELPAQPALRAAHAHGGHAGRHLRLPADVPALQRRHAAEWAGRPGHGDLAAGHRGVRRRRRQRHHVHRRRAAAAQGPRSARRRACRRTAPSPSSSATAWEPPTTS